MITHLNNGDLQVVDDERKSSGPGTEADARQVDAEAKVGSEFGIGIGQHQNLQNGSHHTTSLIVILFARTLSETPSTLPQPDMTNASLAATQAMTSTPLALNSLYF